MPTKWQVMKFQDIFRNEIRQDPPRLGIAKLVHIKDPWGDSDQWRFFHTTDHVVWDTYDPAIAERFARMLNKDNVEAPEA